MNSASHAVLVAGLYLSFTPNGFAQEATADRIGKLQEQLQRQTRLADVRLHALQIRRVQDLWEQGHQYDARRALAQTSVKQRGFEFAHLNYRFHHNQQTLTDGRHSIGGKSIAISSDGKRVVAHNQTTHVWELRAFSRRRTDGKKASTPSVLRPRFLAEPQGNQYATYSAAISDNGKTVAVGTARGTALWSLDAPKEIRRFAGDGKRIIGVHFSDDDERLTTVSTEGVCETWEVESGAEVAQRQRNLGRKLETTALSPDGRWLATGGEDLTVWNTETGETRWEIKPPLREVRTIQFSFDGKSLLCGGMGHGPGSVQLYESETGKLIRKFPTIRGQVFAACMSQDARLIAGAGGYDGTVRVCETDTGNEIERIVGQSGVVNGLAFLQGGRRLVCTGSIGTRVLTLGLKPGPVTFRSRSKPAFSDDSKHLATIGLQGILELRDAVTGEVIRSFGQGANEITAYAFTRDNQRIVYTSKDGKVLIGQLDDGKELQSFSIDQPAYRITLGDDDRRIAVEHAPPSVTGRPKGAASVWDLDSGRRTSLIEEGSRIALSPDGGTLVTTGKNKVSLWNAASGKKVHDLGDFSRGASLTSLKFSPDGKHVGAGLTWPWADGGFLRVWNVATGKEILTLRGKTEGWSATQFAWSPDSKRVMRPWRPPNEGAVGIWDIETGDSISQLRGHVSTITSATFFPSGDQVASTSRDGSVKIWDVETGTEVLELDHGGVSEVVVSPDGRFVVSSNAAPGRRKLFTHKLWKGLAPSR